MRGSAIQLASAVCTAVGIAASCIAMLCFSGSAFADQPLTGTQCNCDGQWLCYYYQANSNCFGDPCQSCDCFNPFETCLGS